MESVSTAMAANVDERFRILRQRVTQIPSRQQLKVSALREMREDEAPTGIGSEST